MSEFPSFREWQGISDAEFAEWGLTEADYIKAVEGTLLYQCYVLAREADSAWCTVFTSPQARWLARVLRPWGRWLRRRE